MDKKYKDALWLSKTYLDDRQSAETIAHFCGVSSQTIRYFINKYNLRDERVKIDNDLKEKFLFKLKSLYIDENLSVREISCLLEQNEGTIMSILAKNNIQKSLNIRHEKAKEARAKTLIKKYGVNHVSKIPGIKEKIEATNLARYGHSNVLKSLEIREKIKATNLERYGVETPLELKEFRDKSNKTCLEKYGEIYPQRLSCIKDKTSKTNLERYGFDNPMKVEEFANKQKESVFKNYGVDHPLQSMEIYSKLCEYNLEKFGVDNVLKLKETRDKSNATKLSRYGTIHPLQNENILNKVKNTNLERYGTKWSIQNKEIRSKGREASISNGLFTIYHGKTAHEWANEYDIPMVGFYKWIGNNPLSSREQIISYLEGFERHKTDIENIIEEKFGFDKFNKIFDKSMNYRPDFKLTNSIALNVDGLYWHSELTKDKSYHFEMRSKYEAAGLRILQFREDEIYQKLDIVESMINNVLHKNTSKIGARKCSIQLVKNSEASKFLEKNHIKGAKHAKHIGLYYNDELLSVMSYKTNSNLTCKIERFCTKLGTVVSGSFSRLLGFLIKNNEIAIIHYWVDLRYGSGKFLQQFGFVHAKDTLGWNWTDKVNTYNRLRCRANMDKRGLSQAKHAEELKWFKIYDAGQRLYILNNKTNLGD